MASIRYENLFTYIKRNKILPKAVAAIHADDPKVYALLKAIEEAHFTDEIFSDPDCDVYLLYLFKQGKITNFVFISSYLYLMSLMEFSDKQALRDEHRDLKYYLNTKQIISIKTECLIQDGKLSEYGEIYLTKVREQLQEKINVSVTLEMFKEKIQSFPLFEQHIIVIKFKNLSDLKVLGTLLELNPTLATRVVKNEFNKKQTEIYFPLFTLHRLFLTLFCDNPMEEFAAFGRTGNESHLALKSLNQHHLPLYSKKVFKNLTFIHGMDEGPFSVAIHDLAHVFWASLLASEQRKNILNGLIPDLLMEKSIIETQLEKKDEKALKLLKQIQVTVYDQLGDLVVPTVPDYKNLNETERFVKYVEKCFYLLNKSSIHGFYQDNIFHSLGDHVLGNFYFFVARIYFRNENHHPALWQHIYEKIGAVAQSNESRKIRDTLSTLAKASLSADDKITMSATRTQSISWKKWAKKLNKTEDSALIWKWAIEHAHDDLLNLINHCNLIFFHPFLPLTKEKHHELLCFVENQLQLNEDKSPLLPKGISLFNIPTQKEDVIPPVRLRSPRQQ